MAQWLIFQSGVSSMSLLVWIHLNHSNDYIISGSRDHRLLLVKSTFVFVCLIMGAFLWTIALFVLWKGSMENNVHILLFALSTFVLSLILLRKCFLWDRKRHPGVNRNHPHARTYWTALYVSLIHTHTHTHTHPLLNQHIKTPNACSILSPELVSIFQRRLV